jgi:predicted nucleic acid-binding protein
VNVLIDTNIVLDVLLKRMPWLAESQQIWQACDDGRLTGYLLASTITDIFYIARKIIGRNAAYQSVDLCLTTFAICPLDKIVLEQALLLAGPDFEDNVQIAAATHIGLDAIVTRNPDDFAAAAIPVLIPAALLHRLP